MKMKKTIWCLFLLISFNSIVIPGSAIESPEYTVVHTESDFEIRLYRSTAWISAPSDAVSFEKATKSGFHRLFQYIQGANLNSSRIRMTKPILTSIVPGTGPLHSSSYYIRLYLPMKFQDCPPVPLPELNLVSDEWAPVCVAVRSFSGFAKDGNVVKEAEKLALSLSKSGWGNVSEFVSVNAYSVAQYNSPLKILGRVNEVWVDVNNSDCESGGYSTY